MEDWAEVHRLFHREGLPQGGDRPPARHEPQHRRPAARPRASRRGTCGRRRAPSSTPSPTRIAAMLAPIPTVPGDGHPRAPAAARVGTPLGECLTEPGIRMAMGGGVLPTTRARLLIREPEPRAPASPAASHGGRTPWRRRNRWTQLAGIGPVGRDPIVGLALLRPVDPFDDCCVPVRRADASWARRAGPGGGGRR